MFYLYQHKTVDEYLFLVVKFISFNLLDFFPYSVKEGDKNKSEFSPLFHSIYQESEKKQSSRKGIKGEFSDSFRYKIQKPVLFALPFHPRGHLSIGRKFCYFPQWKT